MTKILVLHGASMNMRGKVKIEVFGPLTLPQYDEHIRRYAEELGVEVEIFHSNIEGEIINKIYEAHDRKFDAAIFNPSAFAGGYPGLVAAIGQVSFPTFEVHIANPARSGNTSDIAKVCRASMGGFGIIGYYLALRGARDLVTAK